MSRPSYYEETKANPDIRAYRLWNNARQRSKREGIEFTISLEQVKWRFAEGVCEVTGLPFSLELGSGQGRGHPFSPSLDRKDPSIGYTPENTQVVIWMYNAAKHVSTHAHVMQMAEALLDRRG
jgi:hypothetical protein